mmetsp:Transcript_40462/g.46419  ORF Transcript_40462/g.46419 Transcript_40462/m.46419 type:complete len:97 (-) Transcript_40462:43-333(-)
MFKRDVKKQFNASKYKYMANAEHSQRLIQPVIQYHRALAGMTVAVLAAFSMTKRYYEVPHPHKDTSKPMVLHNGELHPNEVQPASARGMKVFSGHL